MESELKLFSPSNDQSHEPTLDESPPQVHESPIEALEKDERPLLDSSDSKSESSSSPSVYAEAVKELEKKFAAYVRNDMYGTMGRGELPLIEKVKVGLALVTLVPIRVIVGLVILVLYYLICRFCTVFSVPNREDGQEDYAHMVGWRRVVIVQCGRFLSRAMFFTMGFYWISETRRDLDAAEKMVSEDECKDQSEECERPGAIISNHVSYLDILYHMSSSFPSFVAKVL
ncbi:hypothetical protein GIB67_017427 [Kingdonia uniflora]|uniref:Phospholipid/glycerol acyltransferase domain-containing protein n=1 Tax=Kingdonia uniflora TaxID=39325 RepID=A0A7J7M4J1_9MAGN|nr:hypothetical protein GIB67_017427 [Kingdonia uniflora]